MKKRKALLITDGDYWSLYGKFPVGLKSYDENLNYIGIYKSPKQEGWDSDWVYGFRPYFSDTWVEIPNVTGAYNCL